MQNDGALKKRYANYLAEHKTTTKNVSTARIDVFRPHNRDFEHTDALKP